MKHEMNSDQVFEAIEKIAQTSGKNDKTGMVKACVGSAEFMRTLISACDPTISYGIKKIPSRTSLLASGAVFDGRTWGLVGSMRKRSLTGSAMLAAVAFEMDRLSQCSSELLKRILLKDLRAGFAENTVNKVAPGSIESYPYMRCSLPKHVKLALWNWGLGVFSQEKADGMFTNIDVEPNEVIRMSSRQGTEIDSSKFPKIAAAAIKYFKENTQTHGELLVKRDGVVLAREIGNGILNHVIKGGDFQPGDEPVYMAWDNVPLEYIKPKGRFSRAYASRYSDLRACVKRCTDGSIGMIETRIVKSLSEAYDHYREMLKAGKEGTVIKEATAIWGDYTSKSQIKLKLDAPCELEVIGFIEGNGKNAATFGSLLCASSCREIEVAVSGFPDSLRQIISDNRENWMSSIITVTSNAVMTPSKPGGKHSLFLPRFTERRHDKFDADSLKRVKEQFENAISAV